MLLCRRVGVLSYRCKLERRVLVVCKRFYSKIRPQEDASSAERYMHTGRYAYEFRSEFIPSPAGEGMFRSDSVC